MAPAGGGTQCLVPWQRRAAAAGQQLESVAEPFHQLGERQRAQPDGGQFQRERDAVQAAARRGDKVAVVFVDGESGDGGAGAVGEQDQRVIGVGWIVVLVRGPDLDLA